MKMAIESKSQFDDQEENNTSRVSRYYRMVDQHVTSFHSILSSSESDWEFIKQRDSISVYKYEARNDGVCGLLFSGRPLSC
jgi:hypothetical protein